MAASPSDNQVLPPPPLFPYILDGIHDGLYDQARHHWNQVHSRPFRSLDFFIWCLNNWIEFSALHDDASHYNFGHLFDRPYKYFMAMVIVGANSELEEYRYEWSSQDVDARFVIGFLFRIRNLTAEMWPDEIVFNDSEMDYYLEANQT